jgi:hypothetical protein
MILLETRSHPVHVMFALDKEALQQLRDAGAHAFYIADVQLHASSQGDQGSTPLADLSTRSRYVILCSTTFQYHLFVRSSFGSDDFKAIVRKKPLLLMRVLQVRMMAMMMLVVLIILMLMTTSALLTLALQAGYNVLLSDCDVVFLDNPFTTLINSQLQVPLHPARANQNLQYKISNMRCRSPS